MRYRPHCCVCILRKMKYVIYTVAAGKKDLAHGVFCLDLSLKVLESQIFLANNLDHSADVV